jgi:hypothetical protein
MAHNLRSLARNKQNLIGNQRGQFARTIVVSGNDIPDRQGKVPSHFLPDPSHELIVLNDGTAVKAKRANLAGDGWSVIQGQSSLSTNSQEKSLQQLGFVKNPEGHYARRL